MIEVCIKIAVFITCLFDEALISKPNLLTNAKITQRQSDIPNIWYNLLQGT